jgi:hypothetical protein
VYGSIEGAEGGAEGGAYSGIQVSYKYIHVCYYIALNPTQKKRGVVDQLLSSAAK